MHSACQVDNNTENIVNSRFLNVSDIIPGQKLLGVPIVVQPSQAEKNRVGNYADPMIRPEKGPMKLYVGNLHCNISDEMLKGIFEPFGRIHSIQLMKDQETDRSKGYGFITYMEAEDAKKAMEHLNGFELAGKDMKVSLVNNFNSNMLQQMSLSCAIFFIINCHLCYVTFRRTLT